MALRNGNNGSNFLFGTFGSDVINGRGGNDFLFGWFGNDILRGGNGNDWLFGGFGSDRLYGGNGNDVGFGGSGNDRLVGGRGSDTMFGGSGNDTFVYRADRNVGETDFYAGGSGNDRLVLRLNAEEAANTDIQADIAAFEAFIAAGGGGNFTFDSLGLTVNSIERLTVRAPEPVEPTNTAPVVSGAVDLGITQEDTSFAVTEQDLLAGATDADGNTLSVTGVAVASGNATVTGNATEGFTITPAANFNGDLELAYTIEDGEGGSVAQTAGLVVNSVNDAPEAPDVTLTVSEDGSLTFLASDYALDVDGDALVLGVAGSNTTGQLQINGASATYTPGSAFQSLAAGETLDDTFVYTVDDGIATTTGTVTVTVEGVNDDPTVGAAILLDASDESTARTVTAADLLAGASDVDSAALAVGTVTVTSNNASVAAIGTDYLITPDANDESEVTLSYTITDGDGGSVTQTASFDLLPVITNNDPTVLNPLDLGPFDEDTSLFVTVSQLTSNIGDADGDSLNISAAGVSVTAGDATVTAENGGFRITPAADFNTDPGFINLTLAYTVEDGQGGSVDTTANVIVTGVDDVPVIETATLTVSEDGTVSVSPYDQTFDPDGDALSLAFDTTDPRLSLTIENGFAEIVYTPDEGAQALGDGEELSDSFTYTMSDGPNTVTGTVNVTIEGANDAPVANDDPESLGDFPLFQAVTPFGEFFNVLSNDSDPENDDLEIIGIGLPGDDAILFGAEGTEVLLGGLEVERVNGEFGQQLFIRAIDSTEREVDLEYTVSDGSLTDTATVTFFVTGFEVF